MARKSSRRVPRGMAHSNTSIHPLTAIKQPSTSITRAKRQRRQEYFKCQRRRVAFAAQRKKRSGWAAVARDTQRIILGDGKYTTQCLSSQSPSAAQSPFRYAMPVAILRTQDGPLPNVVQNFYDIAPQIVISRQGTTFYPHCSPDLANWREYRTGVPVSASTRIRFVFESTLTAARQLIAEDPRWMKHYPNALPTSSVGILSSASAKRPGGGFLNGGDEQEEILARSTSLVASLRSTQGKEFYRTHRKFLAMDGAGLHDHSMVYSPGVVAFRRDDRNNINDGSTIPPYLINVLSSVPVNAAAIRHNYLMTPLDAHIFEDGIRNTMRDRMARLLRIFEIRGDRALVLGAFGCGSSQNCVEVVAELWAELLVCGTREGTESGKEETRPAKFKGIFEEIIFAVPGKLFAPFKHAFEMKVFEMEVISATNWLS